MNIDQNENIRIVSQFNEALNDANIEAMMVLTTENTIFDILYRHALHHALDISLEKRTRRERAYPRC